MATRASDPAREETGRPGLRETILGLLVLRGLGRDALSGRRSGARGSCGSRDASLPQASRADRPTALPMRGWSEVLWRVKDEITRDNIAIVAAGCAFYGLLSLFPAITALVSIYGLVADPAQVEQQLAGLAEVVPEAAFAIIREQVRAVASGGGVALGWGAALSIAVALWSASTAIKTIFTALNIAYEEEEQRGFLRFNAIALLFTLAATLGAILGLLVIVGVPALLARLPLGPLGGWLVRMGSWATLLALVMVGLAAIYRWGPSRAPARWRWISPGSLAAAALWMITSAGFSFYAASFGSYNETYGALGGVIILLMWLWISAFVVLLGAEINAELELETSRDTTTGTPQPIGERGAFVADRTKATRER